MKLQGANRSVMDSIAGFRTQQMHASGCALRGFTPCPDSVSRSLTVRPIAIKLGILTKISLDSEQDVKPEDTSN